MLGGVQKLEKKRGDWNAFSPSLNG
jgi:hypothetical protein